MLEGTLVHCCILMILFVCLHLTVSCGDPGQISNGKRHGDTFTVGSSVTYTCDLGFIIKNGAAQRRCQANGVWSGSAPKCIQLGEFLLSFLRFQGVPVSALELEL